MEGLAHWTPEAGTPQGAVVSPLLFEHLSDPLDHEVADSGYEMCAMQTSRHSLSQRSRGQSSARKSATLDRRMPGCDCIRKRPASSTPRNVVL